MAQSETEALFPDVDHFLLWPNCSLSLWMATNREKMYFISRSWHSLQKVNIVLLFIVLCKIPFEIKDECNHVLFPSQLADTVLS